MITITERKKGNESYYVKSNSNNDDQKVIHYPVRTREYRNNNYYFLYDSKFNIMPETYYVNGLFKTTATKQQALYAFKYLRCFLDCFDINLEKMSIHEAGLLILFLKGNAFEGHNESVHLCTDRSNSTVSQYLTIYRKYIREELAMPNHVLLHTKNKGYYPSQGNYPATAYQITTKTNKSQSFCPPFIYPNEFIKLLKVIRSQEDEVIKCRDEIIVRLMYEYGLRIGEVLCITREDLEVRHMPVYDSIEDYDPETGEVKADFRDIGIVTLRNRNIREQGRNCKNLMRVTHPNVYTSKEYQSLSLGFSEVPISLELYNMMLDYYKEALITYKENDRAYLDKGIADSISFMSLPKEERERIKTNKKLYRKYENRYLFQNMYGGRMSYVTWNGHLKRLFMAAGIEIDVGTKKIGLNHRFRHGFAMMRLHELKDKGPDALKILSKELRHINYASVNAYINPTPSQVIKSKNKYLSFDHIVSFEELDQLQKLFDEAEGLDDNIQACMEMVGDDND